ncbi:MAG: ProQ/FINO family protein [Hylemonella sp.]|jgi:sRNA-binding protein|uniref:ProQ/FINO family protein n=1 Tax=Hylemonella sp. TaxID=2066020 RepID=UPI00391943C5
MTTNPSLTAEPLGETPTAPAAKSEARVKPAARKQAAMPVLEQLFGLYPHLFGAEFLPLKRGIFQDLLERHPELFQRDSLKAALAVHARSTPYLQCVAAGKARHDLDGAAVEAVAPEHVYQAVVELHRRRQVRTREDLLPKLRAQLSAAFEASGLSRQDYLARVMPADEAMAAVLDAALGDSAERIARQEALNRAFEASGKSARDFAGMYGVQERDVIKAALACKRRAQAAATTA